MGFSVENKEKLTELSTHVGGAPRSKRMQINLRSVLTKFHCPFKIIIVCSIQKTHLTLIKYVQHHIVCQTWNIMTSVKRSTTLPLEHERLNCSTTWILEYQFLQFCSESWNAEARDEPVNFIDNPLRLYQEFWNGLNTPFVQARFYFYHCQETQGLQKLVSILNLAWPLKSLDFGAFEPFLDWLENWVHPP